VNLREIQNRIDQLSSETEAIRLQCISEKEEVLKAKCHLRNVEEAQKIAQIVAANIERKAHSQISGVVSLCLAEIFGGSYKFQLRFDRKRGKTQISLDLLKDGNSVGNVLENDSGGVADICGFALRLSAAMLMKPRPRRILILDEPFKFVSMEYRSRIKSLIEKLSKDFELQIVLVTHIKELELGKIINL